MKKNSSLKAHTYKLKKYTTQKDGDFAEDADTVI